MQWLSLIRIHHNYQCISLAAVGLSLLVLAIFMHDISFGGENGHIEHGEAVHEKTGDGEAEHGHHEHGGIGETLETIFTVLGGLILLGAHFLNIRLTKNSS